MVSNRHCIATAVVIAAGLGCTSEQRSPFLATSPAEARAPRAPTVTPQETGTTQRFFAVSPVNAAVVWASARGGTFARTLDGGSTWVSHQVAGAETMEFRDVEGVSANVAYLMSAGTGPDNRIYKTEDGGNTWRLQAQATDPRDFWDCFAFWTPRRAILMDDSYDAHFPLRHTNNGGNDGWPLLRNPPAAQPGEGAFAASGTCAATQGESNAWLATGAAAVARVLRTTDAGRSWQSSATPIQPQGTPTSGNASVDFRDARHGLVGGGDVVDSATPQLNVARSGDGGMSWKLTTPTPFPGAVYGLTYARNHHEDDDGDDDDDGDGDDVRKRAVATGPGGSAWTDNEGQTWTLLPGIANCWAVAFANERTGWLGCGAGRIYRIDF
ncbi:MAG: hypothetical protein E6J67_10035 [Deltaproteobacteria bacterium]|nr:MAG: hypothetical protein E6J67_10035 [Deltaproteobacteria bacterium]